MKPELITSYQELLEACKNLVTPLRKGWNVSDMQDRVDEAIAAIAKAEPLFPKK